MITFSNKEESWVNKFNNCLKTKTSEEEFIALLDMLSIDIHRFENFV